MEIIKNEETYNIAFGTDHLLIKEIKVPNVFIDLSKESGEIELLLFFDLRDLAKSELIKGLLLCREWCAYMAHEYGFTDYICQIDNGSENEFFFDKNSWGPYYELLKSQT